MKERRGAAGVVEALRSQWWIVALCAIVAGLVAFGAKQFSETRYEATAAVLFRSTNLDASVLNGSSYFGKSQDPLRTAATNFELAKSPEVASRSAKALGPPWTGPSVQELMDFREVQDSDVVQISATDANAETAALVANTWARQLVAYRRESDRAQVAEAISLMQAELAKADSQASDARSAELRKSLDNLRVVQALQTGGVEFIEPARAPSSPTGTPVAVIVAGAVLAGLLVGGLAAVLVHRGDRRLKSAQEAADLLGLPLLASVPRLRGKGSAATAKGLGAPEAREAFRTLAVRLRFFDLDNARQVVAVTSGEPREGKTLVSVGLALTYAAMGRRVVLVECDLREGDLRLCLPVTPGPGLAEVVSGQADLDDVLVWMSVPDGGLASNSNSDGLQRAQDSLAVLQAGLTPPNPVQMLSSRAMHETLETLREHFDHVILDTAPLLRVSDTETLLDTVDGFLAVTRIHTSTTDDVRSLARILSPHNPRALGIVVNDVPRRDTRAGYYGPPSRTSAAAPGP